MANQDLSVPGSIPIIAKDGVVDNNKLTQTRAWFKINGGLAIFGRLERLNAKRLSFSLNPESILAIHSNDFGGLFVQTNQKLYLYQESDLFADEITADADGSVMIDESTGQHMIVG